MFHSTRMGTSQCSTGRGSRGWWPVQSVIAPAYPHPASFHAGNHCLLCVCLCVWVGEWVWVCGCGVGVVLVCGCGVGVWVWVWCRCDPIQTA